MSNCYRSVEESSTLRSSRRSFENGFRSIQKNVIRWRKFSTLAQLRVRNVDMAACYFGTLFSLEKKALILKNYWYLNLKNRPPK